MIKRKRVQERERDRERERLSGSDQVSKWLSEREIQRNSKRE